jgi:hypothetical protein
MLTCLLNLPKKEKKKEKERRVLYSLKLPESKNLRVGQVWTVELHFFI